MENEAWKQHVCNEIQVLMGAKSRMKFAFSGRSAIARGWGRAAALAFAAACMSGCALIEPPYGLAEPPSPTGALAVVSSRALDAAGQAAPGTVLWKLEGGSPALLHQSGQLLQLMRWGVAPGLDPAPAFVSYGPYWEFPVKAPLRVRFRLNSKGSARDGINARVATLDIHEPSAGVLASLEVMRSDFPAEGGARDFTLDFQNDPARLKRLEFRVAWWGTQELRHESTEILSR